MAPSRILIVSPTPSQQAFVLPIIKSANEIFPGPAPAVAKRVEIFCNLENAVRKERQDVPKQFVGSGCSGLISVSAHCRPRLSKSSAQRRVYCEYRRSCGE